MNSLMKILYQFVTVTLLLLSGYSHAEMALLSWNEMIPIEERHTNLAPTINHDIALDAQAPQIVTGNMVESLNNSEQTIAGFVVPLEVVNGKITEFLMVPFFGACLHVPPPPPNQIVYVRHAIDYVEPWEPIAIPGVLKVDRQTTDEIVTGYILEPNGKVSFLKDL